VLISAAGINDSVIAAGQHPAHLIADEVALTDLDIHASALTDWHSGARPYSVPLGARYTVVGNPPWKLMVDFFSTPQPMQTHFVMRVSFHFGFQWCTWRRGPG
jgi:hypothetical protein